LAVSAPLAATDTGTASVGVTLEGMRNQRGVVLVCVTHNAAAFPDCSRDASATRLRLTAADATNFRVSVPAGADYAVAIVHDENANGRMDTMLAIPREGFGFSRNPRLRMGPPSFASAAFAVGHESVNQTVRLRYML
jgi:uncharacterized protein (DUF2141 family)